MNPLSGIAGGTTQPTRTSAAGRPQRLPRASRAGELAGIKQRLWDLADDVLEGRQDRAVAAVASQVLNVYLRALSLELKVREQQEITERLEELETLLEQRKGERRYGA